MIAIEDRPPDHPAARLSGPARLDRPVRRIVSLLPSATEIVAALGLADRLVGITHECDFPPAIRDLPRLTADLSPGGRTSREIDAAVRTALTDGHGLYRLDAQAMTALRPDLVLTQELCSVCAVSYPAVLEAARLGGGGDAPLVVSLEPHTLDDVLATIALVADLCGEPERGDDLVAGLRTRVERAGGPGGSPSASRGTFAPRVAIVEWLDPLFAPGHWVPDMVAAAGGASAFGTSGTRSVEAPWTALSDGRPDIVVLGLCGFDLDRTVQEWASFEVPAELRTTPAWADGAVWAIDGSAYVSRPGPRLIDGIEIIAAIIAGRSDQLAVHLPTGS